MSNKYLSSLKVGPNSDDIYIITDATKVPLKTIVTDTSSTTKTIATLDGNTNYHLGTLTNLTITSVTNSDYQSNIFFTSGSSISVNLPASLNLIGNVSFSPSHQYVISIVNNIAIVSIIGE